MASFANAPSLADEKDAFKGTSWTPLARSLCRARRPMWHVS